MPRFRGGGRGRTGRWPGNGPFSHLPPWERPGWRYGPGACWWMDPSQRTQYVGSDLQGLTEQKEMLQSQLESIKQTLAQIDQRIRELEKQE